MIDIMYCAQRSQSFFYRNDQKIISWISVPSSDYSTDLNFHEGLNALDILVGRIIIQKMSKKVDFKR